jgi:hypothetical protein
LVTPDVKDSQYDDSRTQLVPLLPVEEDDASDQFEEPPVGLPSSYHQSDKYDDAISRVPQASDALFTTAQQQPNGSINTTRSGVPAEADVVAAASAAYTAIMQSNQMGNMIDQDLLIKILSDPAQIQRLMKEYGALKHEQSTNSSVASMVQGPPPQMTASVPVSIPDRSNAFHNINPKLPPPPVPNRLPPASVTMNAPASSSQAISFPSGPTRGLNYYQNLIHQHGGERQEPLQQHGMQFAMHHQPLASQASAADVVSSGAMPARDTKQRPTKPCAYFNSARGCRNGANCTFLHDVSAARKEQSKGSKRIKLDSRIAGRYWGAAAAGWFLTVLWFKILISASPFPPLQKRFSKYCAPAPCFFHLANFSLLTKWGVLEERKISHDLLELCRGSYAVVICVGSAFFFCQDREMHSCIL